MLKFIILDQILFDANERIWVNYSYNIKIFELTYKILIRLIKFNSLFLFHNHGREKPKNNCKTLS